MRAKTGLELATTRVSSDTPNSTARRNQRARWESNPYFADKVRAAVAFYTLPISARFLSQKGVLRLECKLGHAKSFTVPSALPDIA